MRVVPALMIVGLHWSGSLFRFDVIGPGLWFHLFQLPEIGLFQCPAGWYRRRAATMAAPCLRLNHRLIASVCLVR
jgi:hypothetical protein